MKIDLPDYSDAKNEQKRRHVQIKPTKPRKFKKFQSFGTATPTPLAILKIRSILEDGPKDLKPFGTKTSSSVRLHRRSVRSVDTNSPTTPPSQDIIPPTQKRVARDSDTAENIEVASITNKSILDYYAKKFLNDAIVARQAIQNPHLIHEPYYQTRDHEKILEPFSISFKEEIGQRPKEATIISPIETIKKIRSKTNERVAEQHQNILKEIANNFEDRQRYLSNQKSSPKKPASSEDIKLYYAKALDGIVKNFEDTANHERTRQEALNTQHEEIIEALKEIAKEKEKRRLAAESEEDDHEEEEPKPEKIKTESLKVLVGEPGGEKLTGDKAEEIIEKLIESEPHQKKDTARDYESTKNIPEKKPNFGADVEDHQYDTDKGKYESDRNIGRETHDYGNDKSVERGHGDYDRHTNSDDLEPHYDHHLEDLGDDKVKVGNEDIVGQHDEHLEDEDLEDISEIDESAIKESGTKESKIKTEQEDDRVEPESKEPEHDDHADKQEIKEDQEEKSERKEESHPEKEATHKQSSDFTFFQPLDFIKDLEKVIYPEVHSKEVHFPDISDKVPHFEHSDVEKIDFGKEDKPFAEDDARDIQLHESIHEDDDDEESEADAKESDEQESKKKEHKEEEVEVEKEQPKEENLETKHQQDSNPFKYSDSSKKLENKEEDPQEDEDEESDEQETKKKESQEEETIEKVTPTKQPETVEEYFDPFQYSDFKKTNAHSEDEEETKNKEHTEGELEAAKSKNEPEEYFNPFKYSDFKKPQVQQEEEESDDHKEDEEELETAKPANKPEIITEYFDPFKYSDFKKSEPRQEDEESDEQETKKKEFENKQPAEEEANRESSNPFKYSDYNKQKDAESDEQEAKKDEHEEPEKTPDKATPFKYSDVKTPESSEKEEHTSEKEDHDELSTEPQLAEKAEEESDDAEEEEDEEEDAESEPSEEDAEKQREEEEKLKKQAENEKALREYINEHFEVDIINGQPVPKAVKDTERYKQIVENVRKPTESFDIFAPNDFNYKNIHGFANKNFNENLKKLEKANNQVEETALQKEVEDDDEEADDEPESEDDEEFDEADEEDEDEKAENTADVPCRNPEFDRIEKSIKQDLKRIPSSKTVESEGEEENEQPKEEQSKQAPEQLKYPHEQKATDIYSDFHKKLINPEPQDSITHQVVHPNLHTGGFKHGGVEVLENAEKVVTVPYDYDYSSSDKKLVVATTPATAERNKRSADWSYEPHSYQPGSYSPESYDPDPNFHYQAPEPQIEAIPSLKKKDEPLGPKAVVFENESGRKKTYIRVKQKQQEMYG